MRLHKGILVLGMIILVSGCAGGLSSIEERRYMAYEREGVLVKEKNPTAGAMLGLLPGIGSFYAREPAFGVVNLLLWPLSILWDPISGYQGAKSINYAATTYELEQEKEKALNSLSDALALGTIDEKQFLLKKRRIENEFDVD